MRAFRILPSDFIFLAARHILLTASKRFRNQPYIGFSKVKKRLHIQLPARHHLLYTGARFMSVSASAKGHE